MLSNTSLIVWIHPAIHKISADKTFTVTDSLISQFFVVTFIHPIYVWIALFWSFLVQLSLWQGKIIMMLRFIRTIISYTSSPLNSTCSSHMIPFSAILVLWNSWIHVCFLNSSDVATSVKAPINKALCLDTTLSISNIEPYNRYI